MDLKSQGVGEHLNVNKEGELLGLYTIDVDKGSFTHDDMWSRIDEIIYEYYKLHPIEMEVIMKENRTIADHQLRNHGQSMKDGALELHHHIRMPVGLLKVLEYYCPELFESKSYYAKFCKRYKALRAYNIGK